LPARADGHRISFLVHRHRRRCEIIFFLRVVIGIDLAMRGDRDLVIWSGGEIDCSEIDVDDEAAAGRAIESLADVFFG
jgi:hypothetical protein